MIGSSLVHPDLEGSNRFLLYKVEGAEKGRHHGEDVFHALMDKAGGQGRRWRSATMVGRRAEAFNASSRVC
jgi:hypothetical protein